MRARAPFRLWIAGLLAALLAVGGLAAPAHAASGVITVSPLKGTSEHGGQPVLNEAGQYSFQIGYGRMSDGEVVIVDVPEGLTIPAGALVVPVGNQGVSSLALTAQGDLAITFANPFPTSVEQGVLDLQFVVDAVTESQVRELVWTAGGKETRQRVYIVEPGDWPTATATAFDKSSTSGAFPVTVDAGAVVLASTLLDTEISYTVTVSSTAARSADLVDVLDAGLEYVPGSLTGRKIVRDGDGLNPVTAVLSGLPAISGSTFTHAFAAEANSIYTFEYRARIADAAALGDFRDQLQAKYDALAGNPDGGTYRVELGNRASFGGQSDTSARDISGTVSAAPQPQVGSAFGKSVDVSSVPVDHPAVTAETHTTGALASAIPVTYTLKVDLTPWAAFDGGRYALTRNVVIRDQLPDNASWREGEADFLVVTDAQGDTVPFRLATGLVGSTETAIAADKYIGTYAIDGQNLFLNIGRDTTTSYDVAIKAQIDDVTGRQNGETPLTTRFAVTNTGYFIYNNATGDTWTQRSATTTVTAPKDTSGGVTDPQTFAKTGPPSEVVGTVGTSITVPFTFTVADGTGDVTKSVITDHIDHTALDVTAENLADISADISVTYGYFATGALDWSGTPILDASYWDLSVTGGGDLEFRLSQKFADALAEKNVGKTQRLIVTIPVPTKPFQAKGTLDIVNSASFAGASNDVVYLSSTRASATTFGNEMEVSKRVYDSANDRFTTNLRAELDTDDALVEDTFIYRVDLIPHGSFTNMVADVVDVLPAGMSFVGWVNSADLAAGTVVPGNTHVLEGSNLRATFDSQTQTVTVARGTLERGVVASLYFAVRLDDPQKNVGVVNVIGGTSATITPADGYPLEILKRDRENATVVIDDTEARFDVLAEDKVTVVISDLRVAAGRLVTASGESPVVETAGVYWVHERVAPYGYARTAELARVDVDEDEGAAAVTIYNTPIDPTYAIGDYTWIDVDRDGLQDSGEPVLPGVAVELLMNGRVIAETVTDEDGLYLFDELAPGTYQVRFTLSAAAAEKYQFTGNVSGTDSVDNSDGVTGVDPAIATTGDIVVGPDREEAFGEYDAQTYTATQGVDPTWDAGVVRKSVSVGDLVWVDTDRDGIQAAQEPGIPGVKLILTGPGGAAVTDVFGEPVVPVRTDSAGIYTFDDLPALPSGQHYTVTIDQDDAGTQTALAPYVPTRAEAGDDRAIDSSTWTATSIDLTDDGDRDPTLDFGFVAKTYAIGDLVWIDADRDGIQDGSEHVLPDVIVELVQDGVVIATTRTDENGLYVFDELPAGTYQVQFTLTDAQAATYAFTGQDAGSDGAVDSDADVRTGRTVTVVLDDRNTALTTEYRFREIVASQGIDPTWDAGVVVIEAEPTPEPTPDPEPTTDPTPEPTPTPTPTAPVPSSADPGTPTIDELSATGGSPIPVIGWTLGGLLLLVVGAMLVLRRRERETLQS
ncbi:SdrD B-like domain-containing protein [Microbacterium memoriense]|uniref:SdrD B-like domain-containing protein n=1 Tax=Microbacterium memoriense TaxID=2978350 RepID=UPI0021C23920|nr:SdrD B-like domain-containing protein [Microbacterium memoriense]